MAVVHDKKPSILDDFSVLGLAIAAVVSIIVTIVVCIWEWVENPGGIFHNAEGTNWQFVFETATSWLIPTFVYTVVVASLGRLLWIVVAMLVTKLTNKKDSGAT